MQDATLTADGSHPPGMADYTRSVPRRRAVLPRRWADEPAPAPEPESRPAAKRPDVPGCPKGDFCPTDAHTTCLACPRITMAAPEPTPEPAAEPRLPFHESDNTPPEPLPPAEPAPAETPRAIVGWDAEDGQLMHLSDLRDLVDATGEFPGTDLVRAWADPTGRITRIAVLPPASDEHAPTVTGPGGKPTEVQVHVQAPDPRDALMEALAATHRRRRPPLREGD